MERSASMWRIIVLTMIPGIILVIQNSLHLRATAKAIESKNSMKVNVNHSLELGVVIHYLQLETGIASLYLSSNLDEILNPRVLNAYRNTDNALERLAYWVSHKDAISLPAYFASKESFHENLRRIRKEVSNITVLEEVVNLYTVSTDVLVDWMIEAAKEERDTPIWAQLVAYHMLIRCKQMVGLERDIGSHFYTHGPSSMKRLIWYKSNYDLARTFLAAFGSYSEKGQALYIDIVDPRLQDIVDELRAEIINNSINEFSTDNGVHWLDNMTAYLDNLKEVTVQMAIYIESEVEDEISKDEVEVVIDVIVLIVTVVVTFAVSCLIYKIAKDIQNVKDMLQEKTLHLEKEKSRTESLLSQLVPAKISKRMHQCATEPEFFPKVTVMFVEISNFDMLMSKTTPAETFALLSDIFEVYEKRLIPFNVSKIACAGSRLMVASGLMVRISARAAADVACFALDLLERVGQIQAAHVLGGKVQLRFGINTGNLRDNRAAVGGVITAGLTRYCLFGDTVTYARTLVDTCLPLHVQISESTFSELSSQKNFIMRKRDDDKKLDTTTYLILGNHQSSVSQSDI
ncbi:receptor-type guanylate cyclase gcy-10-like [Dreissena polymorpha]|uniref:receptor-type guanylate cyclase gcy-10-like n=1 Tax=Dreissena polymorpha TaxID=45954 RepID=UPI002263DA8B|nr:receptor-type guanylate cyclase gcy-10-like [Dreissena polymorpha]